MWFELNENFRFITLADNFKKMLSGLKKKPNLKWQKERCEGTLSNFTSQTSKIVSKKMSSWADISYASAHFFVLFFCLIFKLMKLEAKLCFLFSVSHVLLAGNLELSLVYSWPENTCLCISHNRTWLLLKNSQKPHFIRAI